MTDNTIIWVHGDNLSPLSQPFQTAPDAPALFVWDEALMQEWRITLKRVAFMYECLLELPVTIRRGDVVAHLVAFAKEKEATRLLTSYSPSPRHAMICEAFKQQLPQVRIEVLSETPFVATQAPDLKRFSRYWAAVKDVALTPSEK